MQVGTCLCDHKNPSLLTSKARPAKIMGESLERALVWVGAHQIVNVAPLNVAL